jgi:hypothetical protein
VLLAPSEQLLPVLTVTQLRTHEITDESRVLHGKCPFSSSEIAFFFWSINNVFSGKSYEECPQPSPLHRSEETLYNAFGDLMGEPEWGVLCLDNY